MRYIKLLILITIGLLYCHKGFSYDFVVDGLCYNRLSNNTVEVTYRNLSGKSYSGKLNIPKEVNYNGVLYSVVSIGEYAFYRCSQLYGSLTIPNSVTSIGKYAFWACSNLTGSLTIPNSVKSIGESAFEGCNELTGMLIIPNSVEYIGSNAFGGCYQITGSLIIPDSVMYIGTNPFYMCNGLTSISVKEGNTLYDSRSNCNAIINTLTNELITGCKNTTIPNSVTSIGNNAFLNCSDLTGPLTIPNSVTSIGEYTFSGCLGLTGSLIIPNSVTTIGYAAFQSCNGLTGTLTIPNSVTYIGDWAFNGCSGLSGTLTIPNSITSIGSRSFSSCGFTGSLTIPNSVKSIRESAFNGCFGLTSLIIPNSVTSIGSLAFYSCMGIEVVKSEIEDPFSIGNAVFSVDNKPKHKTLQVPKGTRSKYLGFEGWTTFFNEIIEDEGTTAIDENKVFIAKTAEGIDMTFKVISEANRTCQIGTGNSSSDVAIDKNYIGPITIPQLVNGYVVTSIGGGAFYNCSGLTGPLSFPNSLTSIGSSAFYGCSGLTGSLTIPNTVKTIGVGAFSGCSGLTGSLNIPNSMTSIGYAAFYNCSGIDFVKSEIEEPFSIEDNVFYSITKHRTLQVPKGTKSKYVTMGWGMYFNSIDEDGEIFLTIEATGYGSARYSGTSVRSKIQSFTINEGSSATLTFLPDAGYRIASVKLNDTDVTSSVTNNKYTISNIKTNTIMAVTFEAITCNLSITATGNGSVTYNGTAVRGKTQTFTVNDGTSATITFAPDAGYRIASVKVNGTDVTSSVTNNKYTISSITANTTLAVEFEAIPPTTYTLSITATGNGSATYNSTEVRSKTLSFTVNEGTSATISLAPDTGYRIASVKLNGTDVTSSVISNKYTISNITANTTLAVTFEVIPPTTYTLSITATGNGCATYDGTEVRSKTTSFTVIEGTLATVTFKPDTGYRIASVKVNNTDVTSSIVNNQYTISNISSNTTIEVTFVAITHTLSITAFGNGVAIYGDTEVRGKTASFTVTEGTSATITFAPDAGYRIASVKLDETEITSSVADNKYTIRNITANTTLEVEFVEVITDLAYNGVSYKVVSYDDKTVNVASGNYGLTLTVPATFEAKDKTWTVVGIDSDALANATELAAVIWEPEVLFNNEVSNPNLLLYVKDVQYAPSDIQNVVVAGLAESIVLKDAANGNNFYCPKAFTAKRISYEHHYNMTTGYNTCQGWETIALPFDVTTVLNQKGVDLVPYASWQQGSSQRPFWLYQMTSNGWQAATAIQSNTPYIISMPNNVVYQPSYIQTGYIQFLGSNVEVKASSQLNESQYGKRHFYVSYQQQPEISDIYALNVNNQWSSNTDVSQAEGSAFIRNSRTVHPFEAYMTIEGSNAPWMIPVFDNNMPTNIVEMERMRNVGNEDWYDLQGRKLQGVPKQDGIYIRNGKKIKK